MKIFSKAKNVIGQKTQSIEGKHSTFLAFLHPDWFLPYYIYFKIYFGTIYANTVVSYRYIVTTLLSKFEWNGV